MRRLRFFIWKLGRGFWTITISVFLFLQVYTRCAVQFSDIFQAVYFDIFLGFVIQTIQYLIQFRINVLEKKDVPISKDLPSRIPWKLDQECNMFKVSYLKPK